MEHSFCIRKIDYVTLTNNSPVCRYFPHVEFYLGLFAYINSSSDCSLVDCITLQIVLHSAELYYYRCIVGYSCHGHTSLHEPWDDEGPRLWHGPWCLGLRRAALPPPLWPTAIPWCRGMLATTRAQRPASGELIIIVNILESQVTQALYLKIVRNLFLLGN